MKVPEINNAISMLDDTSEVSDGYHTFGELYKHRITLFIALCRWVQFWGNTEGLWKAKLHSDGSSFEGWFVLGINYSAGKQITYHLPMSIWHECDFVKILEKAPEYDGHTPDDVLTRIKEFC